MLHIQIIEGDSGFLALANAAAATRIVSKYATPDLKHRKESCERMKGKWLNINFIVFSVASTCFKKLSGIDRQKKCLRICE